MAGQRRKYFTYKKYMGDDSYSYAVFPKGSSKPRMTGCCLREAKYYADKFEKEKLEELEKVKA